MKSSDDIIHSIANCIKCPPSYLALIQAGLDEDNIQAKEVLLLANKEWIQNLVRERTIPDVFPTHPEIFEVEIAALLSDRQLHLPDWGLYLLKLFPHGFIPQYENQEEASKHSPDVSSFTLPEILEYYNESYFENSWISPNKYPASTKHSPKSELSWIEEVANYVSTLYGSVPLIGHNFKCNNVSEVKHLSNLCHPECVIFTNNFAFLIQKYQPISVTSLLKYSPALLADSNISCLFIFYQILNIFHSLHGRRFVMGPHVTLEDFKITENLHVKYEPRVRLKTTKNLVPSKETKSKEASFSEEKTIVPENFLGESTKKWCDREISNLEYLLILNEAAGRRVGQPNNHPVVPWVCDFTSKDEGRRDLSKSKFRLTKGDAALDLTYESGNHHVTDVLSEITYYTYKSRITDKSVLCKYVRPSWVPAEYPASIQRMMSWSPDEAIPEFFTDPTIFISKHPDLPDLTLPDWVEDGQEFCDWHRSRLESDEVSRHLHTWIDLTFGYKLSGSSAIRNKNVCLSVSDSHTDLRSHGVLQLFSLPHPVRGSVKKNEKTLLQKNFQTTSLENILDEDIEGISPLDENSLKSKIVLPENLNPISPLLELEALNSFQNKSGTPGVVSIKDIHGIEETKESKDISEDDSIVLGCLLVELYLHKKYLTIQSGCSFDARYEAATRNFKQMPSNVRKVAEMLLYTSDSLDIHKMLPPIPLILNPLSSPIAFPLCFGPLTQMLSLISEVEEQEDPSYGDFCVTVISRTLSPLLSSMTEECVDLMVPMMTTLLQSSKTAVLTAWLLFDQVSSALGSDKTVLKFLESVSQLYMNGTTTAKHAKLYHRTFLLSLIMRFKLKLFLEKFINPLIEAVGGYKDLEWDSEKQGLDETIILDKRDEAVGAESLTSQVSDHPSSGCDTFSEGEVFAFDGMEDNDLIGKHIDVEVIETVSHNLNRIRRSSNESINEILDIVTITKVHDNADERRDEGNISTVASESVMWLAQRLGPVLACRHLSRNLLRMLALCYAGPEGIKDTGRPHRDQKIRVSSCRISGDLASEPVLECLSQLVGLYGDSLVVVQYLPHCWDLVSRAKRRISSSLESCLLAVAAMVHTCIPLLSDTVLMNELPHSLLAHVLAPMLQVTTSRRVLFLTGSRSRVVLLYKLLDALYIIGLRIGEEMARIHLTPLATGFFSSLDKLEDNNDVDAGDTGAVAVLNQLKQVLTPATTFSAYVCFQQLLGSAHLQSNLSNISLVKKLLKSHKLSVQKPLHRPAAFLEMQGLLQTDLSSASYCGSGQSGTGNMIIVSQDTSNDQDTGQDLSMINKPAVDSGRHLKGNWLAYWEHELGKDDRDQGFDFKQIKLQSFTGHVGGIKSLHVMDNENSFLSGGKDKTVRLWSVRNLGEGDAQVSSQSVFTGHKKSVFYVNFLSGSGNAVSCDGNLLVWDPFVMSTVAEYECGSKTSFCAARCLPVPGHCLVAATTEGTVKMIDTRDSRGSVSELRVSHGAAGMIRSLAVSRDGSQLVVGHSSGFISMLDIRTGRMKTGFKGHDGEVLTLTEINKQCFVSTSLDQLASGWRWDDGRQAAILRAFPEPLHCVSSYGDCEVIMGSTANRLIVQKSVETDSPSTVHKLKGDMIKGNLTQMSVLPLNKQLLLASDSGSIYLVC